jgi:methionine-rich copper-binding protein CopC
MKILRALCVVVVAALVCSVGLEAHMKVEKTAPAANAVVNAPESYVQVFFSEAPDLGVSKLEIKGPSDKTSLVGVHVMDKSLMAMIEGDMPDGTYTVSWQSAGPDGHIQKGDFTFTVKRK